MVLKLRTTWPARDYSEYSNCEISLLPKHGSTITTYTSFHFRGTVCGYFKFGHVLYRYVVCMIGEGRDQISGLLEELVNHFGEIVLLRESCQLSDAVIIT